MKITRRQLRQLIKERYPGEVTNIAAALQELFSIYTQKLNFPPQTGGFPATLSTLMEDLGLSESEQARVVKAYRTP